MSSEVTLPRRALPQPHPTIAPGGDCGPCCLAGLLGIDVATVYRELCAGKREALTWYGMREALFAADERLDRIIDETPIWTPARWPRAPWGLPGEDLALHWYQYVRMAFDGGCYALAEVHHAGGGPAHETDHWWLLCGAREIEPPGGTGLIRQQVLVSCPASCPGGRWVDASDVLARHGGYSVLLARPRT
jgi:hypothetical protein